MDPLSLALAVVAFALLGTVAGVATGLIPGLHVNTVAAFVLALQVPLLGLAGELFAWAAPAPADLAVMAAALVVGNVVAHTFLDYVPSIFLGAPEAETALSVLPGHRMLLQGRGMEAIRLSAQGSGAAVLLSLLLLLPIAAVMGPPGNVYAALRPALPLFLVLVAALLILTERGAPSRRRTQLVCEGPEGLLLPGERHPPIPVRTPAEGWEGLSAFLLRGRVVARGEGFLRLAAGEGSVRVTIRGSLPDPLPEEGALFVVVEAVPRAGDPLIPKGWGALLFLLSGAWGSLALLTPWLQWNWAPLGTLGDPTTVTFLPLFTGLFGIPTLVLSVARRPRIPPQDLHPGPTTLAPASRARAILSGSLAGAFVGWIPGVTAATATVLSTLTTEPRKGEARGDETFILSLSCVNTATAVFTLAALFVLLRARSGGMVAIQSLVAGHLTPWAPLSPMPDLLLFLLLAAGLAAGVAFPLTLWCGGLMARVANRVPYRILGGGLLLFLVALLLLLSGVTGLLVAGVATVIGLLPPLLGVRRVHLMGVLLLPLVILMG